MRAFTSISKWLLLLALALPLSVSIPRAWAQDPTSKPAADPTVGDEFSETPFTRYGEFNEDEEEAETTMFFQYGRFFGFSLGMGFESVTGNRGLLWKGGFPLINAKIHYWFNFNLAIQLEFYTVSHFFKDGSNSTFNVSMNHLGVDFKYYFDTRDLSDAITFVSPYILFGGGVYNKSQLQADTDFAADVDSKFGVNLGAALEFPISHKKTYFALEFKYTIVTFDDSNSADFANLNIPDLTGGFFSITGNLLFTW